MYATIDEEVVHDTTVVTSTLSIHSLPVVVLFDSGSTHTFLAKTFIYRTSLTVGDLEHDLVVSTSVCVTLTTGVCVRGVPIVTQRCMLSTDIVVLSMRQFDTNFDI